ncbi:hypothetical protein [Candidatus Methylobacter oryzae]|uniref:hypothetical protein n=1 Tax=Candidatus Methylobacter oryzae TaxID=2497749 RepID=UPI001F4F4AA0|nr:hypothetical protein [Candidatus Methylobacter oryzae]
MNEAQLIEAATLLQQAEQDKGIAPADDAVVYLHQDFSVTASMWHGENVVFDRVSDDWRNYCREQLAFHVPTDLELAADYRQRRTG